MSSHGIKITEEEKCKAIKKQVMVQCIIIHWAISCILHNYTLRKMKVSYIFGIKSINCSFDKIILRSMYPGCLILHGIKISFHYNRYIKNRCYYFMLNILFTKLWSYDIKTKIILQIKDHKCSARFKRMITIYGIWHMLWFSINSYRH